MQCKWQARLAHKGDALLANISSKGFMEISAWQPTDTLKDLVSFRVYLQRFDRPCMRLALASTLTIAEFQGVISSQRCIVIQWLHLPEEYLAVGLDL